MGREGSFFGGGLGDFLAGEVFTSLGGGSCSVWKRPKSRNDKEPRQIRF